MNTESTYRLLSPFTPGDRVRERFNPSVTAMVTALTPKGFAYQLDHPQNVPRLGAKWVDGDCYASGFDAWEKVPEGGLSDRSDTSAENIRTFTFTMSGA